MTRRANDFYETPAWMTRALLHHVPEIAGTILEPCAGDGSVYNALAASALAQLTCGIAGRRSSTLLLTNDIDQQRATEYHIDASDDELYRRVMVDHGRVDWVITNPPYEMPLCTKVVGRAIRHAHCGVAMMLRLSFKEPTDTRNPRGPFLEAHPITRELVMPRHSFTGNGKSDSCTTAWMIWSKVPLSGPPLLSLYKADERFAEPRELERTA